MPELCPNCSTPLPPNAVLCVQCGYHLPSGTILATHVERPAAAAERLPAVDANPYAAPAIEAAPPRPGLGGKAVFDLTEQAAKRVKGVVQDADGVYVTILVAFCICGIAGLVMFPWYSLRLIQWYSLNSQFEELRHPNAFSPYAEITARFPEAKTKLWIGAIVGGVMLGLLVLVVLVGG